MATRGGKRLNAGRPRGSGPHSESTKPIRIPVSLIDSVQKFVHAKGFRLPIFSSKVQAGFPSPADDHSDEVINLEEYLVPHPNKTFLVRISGLSMIDAGMYPNDILIVDRSLPAQDGKIIVAMLDGEFTVKRLSQRDGKIFLLPENPDFSPIEVRADQEFSVWGVVTNVIHPL
jgi:DNA polymerase V